MFFKFSGWGDWLYRIVDIVKFLSFPWFKLVVTWKELATYVDNLLLYYNYTEMNPFLNA